MMPFVLSDEAREAIIDEIDFHLGKAIPRENIKGFLTCVDHFLSEGKNLSSHFDIKSFQKKITRMKTLAAELLAEVETLAVPHSSVYKRPFKERKSFWKNTAHVIPPYSWWILGGRIDGSMRLIDLAKSIEIIEKELDKEVGGKGRPTAKVAASGLADSLILMYDAYLGFPLSNREACKSIVGMILHEYDPSSEHIRAIEFSLKKLSK